MIISMDYTRPNLDLVKEGKVYGLVAQPLYEEFYQARPNCWARRSWTARRLNTATCCRPRSSPRRTWTSTMPSTTALKRALQAALLLPSQPSPGCRQQKTYKLALIQFLKGHPVHRLMQLGFQEGCDRSGVRM